MILVTQFYHFISATLGRGRGPDGGYPEGEEQNYRRIRSFQGDLGRVGSDCSTFTISLGGSVGRLGGQVGRRAASTVLVDADRGNWG